MISRRSVIKAGAALLACSWWPRGLVAAELPAATEAALREAEYIYVATRRKNGALSEIKPIWFYFTDGKIFFSTAPDSWKAKRIAAGSPLYIWIGSEGGPFVEGRAELVTDDALIDRMGEAYAQKYWIAWLGLFKPRASRVREGKTNAYLVTLTQAAPPEAPKA
ncbi:MAG: pyridoxamine 5'-phosphate oxidase family protein [Deltaproteobacteria bacterium]|nr:pyridoxamine 5'-phosphate oxidase family protein [Deltaproteobacteria bacterium]